MTTSSEPAPIWLDGNGKIDEVGFCESFRESHPMLCIHETFFTRDGKVTDESRLKSEIYQMIKPYVRTGVSKKVSNPAGGPAFGMLLPAAAHLPRPHPCGQRHAVPGRAL